MRVRRLALLGIVVGALAATAAPAQAINDPVVPANECSGDVPSVGNTPDGSNPGIAQSPQVAPPVSDNNPGHGSTGAKGTANSNAIGNCHNTIV